MFRHKGAIFMDSSRPQNYKANILTKISLDSFCFPLQDPFKTRHVHYFIVTDGTVFREIDITISKNTRTQLTTNLKKNKKHKQLKISDRFPRFVHLHYVTTHNHSFPKIYFPVLMFIFNYILLSALVG